VRHFLMIEEGCETFPYDKKNVRHFAMIGEVCETFLCDRRRM
jgi:hypothetical protein